MNNIRNLGSIDYNLKLQTGLKNIDKEDLEELVLKINELEKDTIDISAFSRAINRLLDEMEIEFREGVFNSLNIREKMDINLDTIEELKEVLENLDEIIGEKLDLSEGEEMEKELTSAKVLIRESAKENIKESRKIIKLVEVFDDEDVLKDINIKDKVKTSRVLETQTKVIASIKKEIVELEKLLKDIVSVKLPKEVLKKDMLTMRERLVNLVKFLENEDREFSNLLHQSMDDIEEIENDSMFKKFKIDGDLEFKDNIFIEVFNKKESKLSKIDDDFIIKKTYREGRKDLNLGLAIGEILKSIDLEFKDIIIFMSIILITVFILKNIF